MRRWLTMVGVVMVWLPVMMPAQAPAGKLRVEFIDVEGGQATLFVAPGGESLLIDTGWQENGGRDADRIEKAVKAVGLTRLDYVLITHYHEDHVGGVPQLLARVPAGTFLDHGENREHDGGITEKGYAEYLKAIQASGAKRRVMHAGEQLQIGQLELTVISADGQLIAHPLPGGGAKNPYCAGEEKRPADHTENARSLGVELQFGKLKLLDLGDLTWDKETELMCPVNRVGTVDVYIVSHHGWYQSSSPGLVDAIRARAAIMDNGEKKGGSVGTLETLAKAPGLTAWWQLHASAEGGDKNTPTKYIANPLGADDGYGLELVGTQDGAFTVRNGRTGTRMGFAPR